MKILLTAAATLMLTSSAYAYQTYQTETAPVVAVSVDPNVVFVAPSTWTAEQRMLWSQHMAAYPVAWSADQRAAFDAMMAIPPASWTPEQQALYAEHLAYLPPSWTDAQRAAYEAQIAQLHEPWMSVTQTATTETTTTTTTTLASNLPAVVQPSNANPEHDARGIPVISDVAYVPPGFNGSAGGAMGGPSEGVDQSYPACTRERTDNCIQLYERGVRNQVAMGGPYEPVDSSATPAKPVSSTSTTTTTTTTVAKPATPDTSSTTMTAKPAGTTPDDTTPPSTK